MIRLKLLLSGNWTSETARLNRTEVAQEARCCNILPEIALTKIGGVCGARLRFGGVLADASYLAWLIRSGRPVPSMV